MTLLGEHRKLEEYVLEALASRPTGTAEEIQADIESRSRPYSLQAVYQELRKLEKNGIVVRKRGRYSLRLLWLIELADFAERASAAHRKSSALLAELPKAGEKKRWIFSDLCSLLNLWTDLTFLLFTLIPKEERELYERVEHVWFHTANPINENHFIRAMKREKVRYFLVASGDTYLDRSYLSIVKKFGGAALLGRQDFPAQENQYLSVLGDFVIDV